MINLASGRALAQSFAGAEQEIALSHVRTGGYEDESSIHYLLGRMTVSTRPSSTSVRLIKGLGLSRTRLLRFSRDLTPLSFQVLLKATE
jgi:hypothetical protein